MIRGTTPVLHFQFPETIDNYDDILITFAQKQQVVLEKTQIDLVQENNTMYYLPISQEEVNEFAEGIYEVQVRVRINNDVSASKIYRGRIYPVLNDMVLEGEVTNED